MRRIVVASGLLTDVGRVTSRGATPIHGCAVRGTNSDIDLRMTGLSEALTRLLGAELFTTARVVIELGASDADEPTSTEASGPVPTIGYAPPVEAR